MTPTPTVPALDRTALLDRFRRLRARTRELFAMLGRETLLAARKLRLREARVDGKWLDLKDIPALDRYKEAVDLCCQHIRDRSLDLRVALEPKPGRPFARAESNIIVPTSSCRNRAATGRSC